MSKWQCKIPICFDFDSDFVEVYFNVTSFNKKFCIQSFWCTKTVNRSILFVFFSQMLFIIHYCAGQQRLHCNMMLLRKFESITKYKSTDWQCNIKVLHKWISRNQILSRTRTDAPCRVFKVVCGLKCKHDDIPEDNRVSVHHVASCHDFTSLNTLPFWL